MIVSDELLRKVQLKELEILLEIKRICENNNINYYLCFGTLLGAVRHKGFIPWDDDIDIYMKREDYNRFLQIAPTQISDKYFVESSKSNRDYIYSFCKVKANNTIFKEACTSKLNIHQGIWVDIFPLDNLENINYTLCDKRIYQMSIWQTAIDYNAGIIKLKKPISKLFFKLISIIFKHKLLNKKEKIMQSRNKYSANFLIDYNYETQKYKKVIFPKNYYENTIQLEFEGHSFTAPENYDSILRQVYGDYMEFPPIEERINKHEILEVKV